MRRILPFFISLQLIIFSVNAQLRKPVAQSPEFAEKFATISESFYNNFHRIQGELIDSQGDMDTYSSTISIPGATKCVIYRFHSVEDTTAGWQALMYEGDNYQEALKAYKNSCRQIEKCKIRLQNNSAPGFSGKMESPDEQLRFVNTVYKLKTDEEPFDTFYAEVEMINITYDQWKVNVNLHTRKDDMDK